MHCMHSGALNTPWKQFSVEELHSITYKPNLMSKSSVALYVKCCIEMVVYRNQQDILT